MISEIGSEFFTGSYHKGVNEYKTLINYPMRYVLSGRTGLYLIASELKEQQITSIEIPSYCCGSMVAPFVDAGFLVSFYEEFETPKARAILIMDYFGFLKTETADYAKKCQKAGVKIIIDATQTAFSRFPTYDYADYIVVSYRKWLDCLCAVVYSRNGFLTSEYVKENLEYVEIWRTAAEAKRHYIQTGVGCKKDFIELYAKANQLLSDDYIGYKANQREVEILESIDSCSLRRRRRANGLLLLKELHGKVELMFDRMLTEDCPLFIPIILKPEIRMEVREVLIKQNIFCPCHWPVDKRYPHKKTRFHDCELSLVCDQRYGDEDMERLADVLNRI